MKNQPLNLLVHARSMRARMTAVFACLVALLMGVGGTAVQQREVRRADERTREMILTVLGRVEEDLEEETHQEEHHQEQHQLTPLVQRLDEGEGEYEEGELSLLVIDAGGRVLWQSHNGPRSWPLDRARWRYESLQQGDETLIVARNWLPVAKGLREAQQSLIELGVVVIAVTAALAWFTVGRTLSPLEKLAAQARDASIESLQVRLHSPSSDSEMRYLTDTLNSLLARLEDEAQGRGRFYAAASHELRTPIQALLGKIDVALSRPRSVEEYQQLLHVMQRQTGRLSSLVQDLLQLNALEMRQNRMPCEDLNLRHWIELAQTTVQAQVAERGLSWQISVQDIRVTVPVAHLDSLLRNLFENAAKYATENSAMRLSVTEKAGDAYLRLWNACELTEGANPSAWFEPFFRPDASRNSRTGGNGLGLTIAAAIARSNGWRLSLQVAEEGVLAELDLPRCVEGAQVSLVA